VGASLKKQSNYMFGWPSVLGGADTKLAHLISLLGHDFRLIIVPNDPNCLRDRFWCEYIRRHGAEVSSFSDLPVRLEGFGLALSNSYFFTAGIADRAKTRGLKIIWSSEMMWHHAGEKEAVASGVVDKVLFTSGVQKVKLAPAYGTIPSHTVGNYIDPRSFPHRERTGERFTIGRLSRAAPEKYPEDFPVFYERLGLPETRFRVMAWDEELAKKYRWHAFDKRWDLLPAARETQVEFLHSLDLFVYPLGHQFTESWGRSTVEAMLTGAVPIVPTGHHLENLVIDGETGFVCFEFEEFRSRAHKLRSDDRLRREMSLAGRLHAERELCNREKHLKSWKDVFEII
jgi:hypothetical protein